MNGLFDGFDGLVLVNGLDVHGNDLAGIHVQKILQKLVAQVRSRNIQETDRSEDAAHLKGAAVLNASAVGAMASFTDRPLGTKVFPVEVELVGSIHVSIPCISRRRWAPFRGFACTPRPVEVVQQVILDVASRGLTCCHAFARTPKGQVFRLVRPLLPFGKLLPEHLGVLGSHIVKAVFLERDADAFSNSVLSVAVFTKRQLKVDRAVEKVEKEHHSSKSPVGPPAEPTDN